MIKHGWRTSMRYLLKQLRFKLLCWFAGRCGICGAELVHRELNWDLIEAGCPNWRQHGEVQERGRRSSRKAR